MRLDGVGRQVFPLPFRPEMTVKPSPNGIFNCERTPRKPSIVISRIRISLNQHFTYLFESSLEQRSRYTFFRKFTR